MKAPPIPVALLSIVQMLFGLLVSVACVYVMATPGFESVGDVPAWAFSVGFLTGLACVVSAIQLWRLKWSGPISFLGLWLLPLLASLPYATALEIIRDGSFIEGRISFLLVYAVIVFEFRKQFAPNNSFQRTAE